MAGLSSFDVFDTVLIRLSGSPAAHHRVLAERLVARSSVRVTPEVLARTRGERERRLIRQTGRHVTLREIYEDVTRALAVGAEHVEPWARAEEDLERELTTPVPGIAAQLESARTRGEVIFISDTPHTEEFLTDLLRGHGLLETGDRVYTSSSRGRTKSQGWLFDDVAAAEGGTGPRVHYGDDPRADVAWPRVHGWSAHAVTAARLTRYERVLDDHGAATEGLTSWLAGASRLARLNAYERGTPAAAADVASGVMAPLLVCYVTWVLGQARARGLDRLYFVARDGEIMLRLAQVLAPTLAPAVELRLLRGSRDAWIRGACATTDDLLYEWALGRRDFTARTVLGRLGLDPEAVAAAGSPLASPSRLDTRLTDAEREELARLVTGPLLLAPVRDVARGQAERTTAYLRQEGLLDDVRSALVDTGWTGRTAAALDHLVLTAGGHRPAHLFVGQLAPRPAGDLGEDLDFTPWLFDRQRFPGDLAGIHQPQVLIELLCASGSGRTVDYRTEPDGTVTAALDRERNEATLAWGLEAVQRVAVEVAEALAANLAPEWLHQDTTDCVERLLAMFWEAPTAQEIEVWGQFPGEEEIWPPLMPLAQQITTRTVARRVRRGELKLRPNHTWRAGTARSSSQPWRALMNARTWMAGARARAKRIPRRLRFEYWARRRR